MFEYVKLGSMVHLCPACGSRMRLVFSRFGKFYGCLGFPKCRGKMSMEQAYKKEQAQSATSRIIGKREKEIRKAAKAIAAMRK